jgi:hypothetical protein
VGNADPCARYSDAINTDNDVGWKYFGPGKRSSGMSGGCVSLFTSIHGSVKECQASCAAEMKCNGINFNSGASICESLSCGKTLAGSSAIKAPGLIDSVGWSMFTFGSFKEGPTVGWSIGKWSKCKKESTGVRSE